VKQNRTGSPLETIKPAGWRAKRAEERKKGEPPGKRAREVSLGEASLSEKRACHRCSGRLRRRQIERGSKGYRDAKQPDRDLASSLGASIPSEPLDPRETRVRSLSTGQDHARGGRRSGGGWRQVHLHPLVAEQLYTGPSMRFSAPIAPEERGRTHLERMQQHAHLARLCRRSSIPLTLLAEWTRPATPNASAIHDAQAATGFSTLLLGHKLLPSGTAQGSVRLERKV